MATIGTLKRDQADYTGAITILTLNAKVRCPLGERERQGPTFRIFVGKVEVGAAWSKVSNESKAYLSAKLNFLAFLPPCKRHSSRTGR